MDVESGERSLYTLAVRQHGVFARRQALALGVTRRAVDNRIREGRWLLVHRGVYRVAGSPATWEQMVMAAILAAGRGALASHRSTGAMWELEGLTEWLPEVSVPANRDVTRPGIVVHRLTCSGGDRRTIRGIPVTAPAPTLMDLAAVLIPDDLEICLDDALRRRLITVSGLRARLRDPRTRTRHGSRALRRLLDERDPRSSTESTLETEFLRVVRRADLPEPIRQFPITVDGKQYRIDFAYPQARIGIEVDGYAFHASRQRWEMDLERQNALVRSGLTVLRFGATHVRKHPEHISRTLRSFLDGRA